MNKHLISVIAGCALSVGSLAAESDGWVTLFDGKSLKGSTQMIGTATYRVEDGMMIGKTT